MLSISETAKRQDFSLSEVGSLGMKAYGLEENILASTNVGKTSTRSAMVNFREDFNLAQDATSVMTKNSEVLSQDLLLNTKLMITEPPTGGKSDYSFAIQYDKDTITGLGRQNSVVGLEASDLSNAWDIVVTGSGNFIEFAKPTRISSDSNDSVLVTYQLEAPGRYWDKADNGTYSVALQPKSTNSDEEQADNEYSLGSFNVDLNPGSIEIQPTVLANEIDGTAKITIKRVGGSDGAVNVNYTTRDNTAVRDLDYTAMSGIVEFKPGEVRKTVQIPLLRDLEAENDETFMMAITGVDGGATLKSPSSSIVTIIDSGVPLPSDLTPVESRYLFSVRVELDPSIPIGETSQGRRDIFETVGGSFDGPAAQGELLASGGEWLTTRPDGVAVADARLALKTDDGELIYAQMAGFADNFGELRARLEEALKSGQPVDLVQPDYFRMSLRFETGSQRYSWLNQVVTVAKGSFTAFRDMKFDVFQIL